MVLDINSILNFSLMEWIKDKKALKYFFVVFVFYLIVNISMSYFIYLTFMPLVGSTELTAAQSIGTILYTMGFAFVLILISVLIASIFNYFIISKALESKKLTAVPFTLSRWIKFILVSIAEQLAALFSVFKLKLLLIPLAAILLLIVGAALIVVGGYSNVLLTLVGIIAVIFAILLWAVYVVIVIYNGYRLSLSSVIFVEKERGIMESVRSSWEITRGKVIDIFVIMLIIGIAGGVCIWILSLPSGFYSTFVVGTSGSPAAMFKVMMDPIAILLTIPSIIVQAFLIIAQLYAYAGIYAQAKNMKKSVSPQPVKRAFSKPKRK